MFFKVTSILRKSMRSKTLSVSLYVDSWPNFKVVAVRLGHLDNVSTLGLTGSKLSELLSNIYHVYDYIYTAWVTFHVS